MTTVRPSPNFKLERQIITYLSTNFNLAPSKKERMLIINKSLNLSLFIVFYSSTKYLIMLGKVADQGPHTNCTSHSLTFPPPIDLQPSFWAPVNNRESPSIDNPHILFANITERCSRNTNIFQLCRFIFQDLPGEKTTSTVKCPVVPRNMSQTSSKA